MSADYVKESNNNESVALNLPLAVEEEQTESDTKNDTERDDGPIIIEDDYAEAWSELGAPVCCPLLLFLLAIFQWGLDAYFLIKNVINAINDKNDTLRSQRIWVAGITVGFHIICCILVSIIDVLSKDAISGRQKAWTWRRGKFAALRLLPHITFTMKLFRYITAYLETSKKNKILQKIQMLRTPLSRKEIKLVSDIKKNELVESHYDLIEAFVKTVPAALLQVFFMFQNTPTARLKLTTTIDQDRFATVFFTIISTSVSAAIYQFSYHNYKRVLHFQDCLRANFDHKINLHIPGFGSFLTTIVIQMATVGIRICFYSLILFWSPVQFIITIVCLLVLNWILLFKWNRSSWRFRPVLENPLYGTPWRSFDLIDLWINLFIPGVHYPKPIDYFLNFYSTTLIGVVIFKGLDILNPGEKPESFLYRVMNYTEPASSQSVYEHFDEALNFTYFGASDSTLSNDLFSDDAYFIGTILKYLLLVHEHVTLKQISYVDFFYHAVKYMNIINIVCVFYTFYMNLRKFHDLQFPLQIAHDFFVTLIELDWKDNTEKTKQFLLFTVITNSVFFNQFKPGKRTTWLTVSDKTTQILLDSVKRSDKRQILTSNPKFDKHCGFVVKIYHFVSPMVYPERMRVPAINWDVNLEKDNIRNSVDNNVLKKQLYTFIDSVYGQADEDTKFLLAVVCKNFNEIMMHMTSYRISKLFGFLKMNVVKGVARTSKNVFREDFELGYLRRIYKEIFKTSNQSKS